ncbi:MAG: glycosyltransferase [Planctomycetota bacterium]
MSEPSGEARSFTFAEETSKNGASAGVPSLSIIFPVHNEEARIASALMEAVALREEYPAPVEIIVACNGCTDRSAAIAGLYPVRVIESEKFGMSFGNNLGGRAARNELLFFWDADTDLEAGALAALAGAVRGRGEVAGGFRVGPDKAYPRSLAFFWIMNFFCRRRRIPPAGTTFLSRTVYVRIGGFDETIPQGTGSDLVRRAREAGAAFAWVETDRCRTSVRRFEKQGYLRQLLDWRRNIRLHSSGLKNELGGHPYDVIR